ncbi:MAG: PHP domain-containing protein [Microbacteriaceae bacterium]|nr:PHP domain-containing protein [Microbacteriaceae bacterium]
MLIDLHIHSKNSDGDDTISELVPKIAEAGISVFSLTDHDRTDGWVEARELANQHGLSFIPGVEITTKAYFPGVKPRGMHLLAYLVDPDHPVLSDYLRQNREARDVRIRKYIDNLAVDYSGLTYELVVSGAQEGSTLGQPDIANALVKLGEFESAPEVWKSGVLGKKSKYYVGTATPNVIDVIAAVRDAGGVPVVAHPMARNEETEDEPQTQFKIEHFEELVEAGLLGLETNHTEVMADRKVIFDAFAKKHGLITTGSSDYHGLKIKPHNPLATRTTELDQLKRILELGSGSKPTINHSL